MALRIKTDHPIAYESKDTTDPKGAIVDNTHYPWFVTKTQRVFGRKVKHMDWGCAGGGLVKDFLDSNHLSVGVEGCDAPLKHQIAEWRTIPGNLFTGDITKPLAIHDEDDRRILFDVISCWEVMEHIKEQDLPGLFANIRDNLVPGGYFVCSIADFADEGYHVTLKPRPWWVEQFTNAGLPPVDGVYVEGDYVRESSFYITARKPNG